MKLHFCVLGFLLLALTLAGTGCQSSNQVVLQAEFETWVPNTSGGNPIVTEQDPDWTSNCLLLLDLGKLFITISDGSGYTPSGTLSYTISDPTAVSVTSAANDQYSLQILRPEAGRVSFAVTFVATGSTKPVTREFLFVFGKRLFRWNYFAVDLDTGSTVTKEQWNGLSEIEKAAFDFTQQWIPDNYEYVIFDFRAGFIQIPAYSGEFVSYSFYPESENLPIGEFRGYWQEWWKPSFFIVKTSEGRFFKMMITNGTILDYIEILPDR